MPNANAPTGLTPRRYRNGSPWMGAARMYHVPASNATAMFVGDPVVITGTGDARGFPDVTVATAGAGNLITGVIVGFRPSAPFSPFKHLPASTEGYVIVADDPALLYEVQENGTALTAADIGLNAALAAGSGGNTGTGFSSWVLNNSTKATTAGLQVRIVELQHAPDNELGANAKWLVALNQTTETPAAGSTGI